MLLGLLLIIPTATWTRSPIYAQRLPIDRAATLALEVSGHITTDTTWSQTNSPYIVLNDVVVDEGVTLTIEPGVVVKFTDDYDDLIVQGTLVADGTASEPIFFTSINDHTVGGSTGTGTPAGADWSGLYFEPTSSGSILNYVTVRYGGGRSASANVHVRTRDVTITHSTFAYGGFNDYGILFDNALPAALSHNSFIDNGADAVRATLTNNADSIRLSNNTATGNGTNGFTVQGTLSGTVTWDWQGGDSLPFVVGRYLASDLTINEGATLTLTPGTALKFYSDYDDLWVRGTLIADGAESEPIIFTSLKDDSVGGDTNGDGSASIPAGADWSGLTFTPSSRDSVLNNAIVRYGGGRSATANAHLQTGSIVIRDSVFSSVAAHAYKAGIRVDGASPALVGNTFQENKIGVYAANGAQPKLVGNAFMSNTDYGVYNATPSRTIDARENWWGDVSGPTHADNPGGAGDAVTDGIRYVPWIEALAWLAPEYDVLHGTQEVAWRIFGQDAPTRSVKITATGLTQTLTLGEGLDPDGTLQWDTAMVVNGWYALQAAVLDGTTYVDAIDRDVLVLNDPTIAWHAGTINNSETWDAAHLHVLLDTVVIPAGVQVTVAPGAVVKATGETQLIVRDGAALDAQGTSAAPIVFTSLADDTAGGDTNLDGNATVPRPGDWYGIATEGAGQFIATTETYVRYFQRVHAGTLSADQTWEGNVVHRVTGEVVVTTGVRLTLAPGAFVKFDDATGVTVKAGGELVARGSVGQPIYLTSARDDALGGDTNLDADLSVPAPGDWRGLLADGGRITLDHAILQYGGGSPTNVWSSTAAAIATANNGTLLVGNSIIRDPYFEGLIAWGSGDVTITNTVIAGADRGVNSDRNAIVRLTNCTLDDNRIGIYGHGGTLIVINTIVGNSLNYGIDNVLSSPIDLSFSNVWSAQGANYYRMTDPTGANGNVSVDPAYRNRDAGIYQLAYASPMIDAANGAAAPATDYMGFPRYDDPRVANTGTPTIGGAYADIGAYEFVETAESPIDLMVTQVSGPATAAAEDIVRVNWTVANRGSEPAVGPWHDTVGLVLDPAEDADVVEVGEVLVGTDVTLAPGQDVHLSAELRVPATVVGNYYWQVEANTRYKLFEGRNRDNNVGHSIAQVALDLPELTLDAPLTGAFSRIGESHYYRLTAPSLRTLKVTLDSAANSGANELYIAREAIPTQSAFEVRSPLVLNPDQELLVPRTQPSTYYLLVRTVGGAASVSGYTLSATLADFESQRVYPSSGGNTGWVTVGIEGSSFTRITKVTLVGSDGAVISPTVTYFNDATQLYATFDLTGAEAGLYDVRAVSEQPIVDVIPETGDIVESILVQGESVLEDAFEIVEGGEAVLTTRLLLPAAARYMRVFPFELEVANEGSADVTAPVLLVASPNGSPLSTSPDVRAEMSNQLQILVLSKRGDPTVLAPGERVRVQLYALANQQPSSKILVQDLSSPGRSISWQALEASYRDFMPDGEWDETWSNFRGIVGDTWDTLHDAMRKAAGEGAASHDRRFYTGEELIVDLLSRARFGQQDPSGFVTPPPGTVEPPALPGTAQTGTVMAFSTVDGCTAAPDHCDAYRPAEPAMLTSLHNWVNTTVVPYIYLRYGSDVRDIWSDYLSAPPGPRRTFTGNHPLIVGSGNIAGFKNSRKTQEAARYVLDHAVLELKKRLRMHHPRRITAASLPANQTVSYQLSDLLGADVLDSGVTSKDVNLGDLLEYVYTDEIPGNLAGGIGKNGEGSDIFGDDRRQISGAVNVTRLVVNGKTTGIRVESDFNFTVLDTVDLCPGDLGAWYEQPGTIPMKYLEANGWAHDVGFTAIFSPSPLHETISANMIPDDFDPKIPAAQPPTQTPSGESEDVPLLWSDDPNDITGPAGFGDDRWIVTHDPLPYMIRFENDPEKATAPAQEVIVTTQLDTHLDWTTFRLSAMGFGGHAIDAPPDSRSFNISVDWTNPDGSPLSVEIDADLDLQTGMVTWRLTSVDPGTGLLPFDPFAGFLPPNDETHRGEGFMTYHVQPKADLPNGTVIHSQAEIVFDLNEPIVTNAFTNTIDIHPPDSTIAPLPAMSPETFSVAWSGSDPGGSGIAVYDVYVSDNGGPFVRWQSSVTETQASFAGADGHTYGFYSVATDNVGHRQTTPTTAQAITTVETASHIYLPLVVKTR